MGINGFDLGSISAADAAKSPDATLPHLPQIETATLKSGFAVTCSGAQLGNFEMGCRYIFHRKDEIIHGLSLSVKCAAQLLAVHSSYSKSMRHFIPVRKYKTKKYSHLSDHNVLCNCG